MKTPHEVLTFCLGAEEYGINILQVQEIRRYEVPTRIANTSPCLKGVMNLRGVIVPIIDLRVKLGLQEAGYGGTTATVVLNLSRGTVGVVVDAVRDVLEIAPAMVKPPPGLDRMAAGAQFLTGIATLSSATGQPDRLLLLTDIEALVQTELDS